MKWFNNLSIRWKLVLGYGIIIALFIILSIISIATLNNVDSEYSYLLDYPQKRLTILKEAKNDVSNIRRTAITAALFSGDVEQVNNYYNQFKQVYIDTLDNLDKYCQINDSDMKRDPEIIKKYQNKIDMIKTDLEKYDTQIVSKVMEFSLNGQQKEAVEVLLDGSKIIIDTSDILDGLVSSAEAFSNEVSAKTTENKNKSDALLILLSAFIVLLSIAIALFIGNSLANPIRRLVNIADDLVSGNLNINKTETTKDEVGHLNLAIYKLIDIIKLLINQINGLADSFEKGEIDASIDLSFFNGSYRTVAESVNSMTHNIVKDVLIYIDCLKEFGGGNFSADIPQLPGKKAVMNENLDALRNNLQSISGDVSSLISDALGGKLSSRADVQKYRGDWARLLSDLNKLMEAIVAPIDEAADVLKQVSVGNFDNKVEGNYQGDFLLIKNSINDTVTNVAAYINEISDVLGAMSENDDLNQKITREYVGKFSNIKNALNNIIDKFNRIISDISSTADQVAAGAKQVSESSMTLAQGSCEQASSVEELNATILNINENTAFNARNAKEAENLATQSQKNAQNGDKDMNQMLISMKGINESSNNIAKIIKVIDDIAFQTNLLALNAAVEAAKAGASGKGFSVVADEVRSLAGKSKDAAKEITDLIDDSIKKVEEGSQTADKTAKALHTILGDVSKVSTIITQISEASDQQAEAISQVTQGLSQITSVVQNNSATSQETASASQELSSQAEVLRNLVSGFRLKIS